jgi:uncharacterized protein YecE (DUF72 family)
LRPTRENFDTWQSTLKICNRGNWKEYPSEVKRLCNQLDLIHVVDALKSARTAQTETYYFRLHGLGPQEVNYRYRYSLRDLKRLRERTLEALTQGAKEGFVLFNNHSMLDDAKTFCSLMQVSSGTFLAE